MTDLTGAVDRTRDAAVAVEAFAAQLERALEALRVEVDALQGQLEERVAPAIPSTSSPLPPRLAIPALPAPAPPLEQRVDGVTTSSARRGLRGLAALLGIAAVVLVLAVTVGPRILPYETYHVRSGSMEPTIPTGAMVIMREVNATTLEVGTITTFDHPGGTGAKITHRIVGIESSGRDRTLITKGDANAAADPWRLSGTGEGLRYVFHIPLVGFVFGALGEPGPRVALLAIPLAYVAARVLLRRRAKGGAEITAGSA